MGLNQGCVHTFSLETRRRRALKPCWSLRFARRVCGSRGVLPSRVSLLPGLDPMVGSRWFWYGERVLLPNRSRRQPPGSALGKAHLLKRSALNPWPQGSCWLLLSVCKLQQQEFGCSPGAGMELAGHSCPDPLRMVLCTQTPPPQQGRVVLDWVPRPLQSVTPGLLRGHRHSVLVLVSPDGFWSWNVCAG